MNKLVVIGAGGAGINIGEKVVKELNNLGDGFVKNERLYIDTSDNNIKKFISDNQELNDKFYLVKNIGMDGQVIAGSGAERSTNAKHIPEAVKSFLDKHKILKQETGVYYLVVFSLNGGSGSVIAPYLIKYMLERNIPVIALAIGDTSSRLSSINTLNTLASLDKISKKANKALSFMYANNVAAGETITEREQNTNKSIFSTLSTLSMFLSGQNDALDAQDMLGIIDPSMYKSIDTKPGLYGIATFSKKINIPDGSYIKQARTLTIDDVSPDITGMYDVHKYGIVISENAKKIYNGQFPIHMITYTNMLNDEVKAINDAIAKFDKVMAEIDTGEIFGSRGAEEDDDGLVF